MTPGIIAPATESLAAQDWADEQRKQMGIHASIDGLRFLQGYVYEHCKPIAR